MSSDNAFSTDDAATVQTIEPSISYKVVRDVFGSSTFSGKHLLGIQEFRERLDDGSTAFTFTVPSQPASEGVKFIASLQMVNGSPTTVVSSCEVIEPEIAVK